MSDRGIKKWNAYKSLVEHEPALAKSRKEKEKVSRPKISNEETEEINEILINYSGETLLVHYYHNGEIYQKEIVIKRIDIYERKLVLTDRSSIPLSEIYKLERI